MNSGWGEEPIDTQHDILQASWRRFDQANTFSVMLDRCVNADAADDQIKINNYLTIQIFKTWNSSQDGSRNQKIWAFSRSVSPKKPDFIEFGSLPSFLAEMTTPWQAIFDLTVLYNPL